MSAENENPSGPEDGTPEGAADGSDHGPGSVRKGVVASHGEREKRAYVAPVEVPRRMQRMATIDMSKVRISPDMKVQQLDPRHMPTTKMDIPPGGIRPPPPPAAVEVADAQSTRAGAAAPAGAAPTPAAPQPGGAASPWSHNAGLDRSMLPSAAIAPQPAAQAQRIPSMPPTSTTTSSGGIGPGIWIAVILVAALLGGGIALALRSGATGSNADPVSSSAPIEIAVPTTTPTAASTDNSTEPEVVEPNGTASTTPTSTSPTTKTTPRVIPRRTSPATKTAAPAPAPAPTTARPRLFN